EPGNGFRTSIAQRSAWSAALLLLLVLLLLLLLLLLLGGLSHLPVGNPVKHAFKRGAGTATAAVSPASSTMPLRPVEILARARSARVRDMSGRETIIYGDGGSTTATIALTSNPDRMHEVDAQFDAQGRLVEVDDTVRDGVRRYLHTVSYRTDPP